MTIKNTAKSVTRVVLLLLCSVSLIQVVYFTYKLDIDRVSLKRGVFKIIDQDLEFAAKELQNPTYNLVLEFYPKSEVEYERILESQYRKNGFGVLTQLIDCKGRVVKSNQIIGGEAMSGGGSRESISWDLLTFNPESRGEYGIRIEFHSNGVHFDEAEKEIYLEEDHDYASAPWFFLLQRVFLILFIATLLPILLAIFFYWKKKWQTP